VAPLLQLLHNDTSLPPVIWNIVANYMRPSSSLFRLGPFHNRTSTDDGIIQPPLPPHSIDRRSHVLCIYMHSTDVCYHWV
jgi:hypothetical protein